MSADQGRDLGVSPDARKLDTHCDRLKTAGDLNTAKVSHVIDDVRRVRPGLSYQVVGAFPKRKGRAEEAATHPVSYVRHLPFGREEGVDASTRKQVVLRSKDYTKRPGRGEFGPAVRGEPPIRQVVWIARFQWNNVSLTQRTAPETSEAGPNMGGPAAKDRRHVDAAVDRDVHPSCVSTGTDRNPRSCRHLDAFPHFCWSIVHGYVGLGARDRDHRVSSRNKRQASHQHFEARRARPASNHHPVAGIVPYQLVGDLQAQRVERPRGWDPVLDEGCAPEILDSRLAGRLQDDD